MIKGIPVVCLFLISSLMINITMFIVLNIVFTYGPQYDLWCLTLQYLDTKSCILTYYIICLLMYWTEYIVIAHTKPHNHKYEQPAVLVYVLVKLGFLEGQIYSAHFCLWHCQINGECIEMQQMSWSICLTA